MEADTDAERDAGWAAGTAAPRSQGIPPWRADVAAGQRMPPERQHERPKLASAVGQQRVRMLQARRPEQQPRSPARRRWQPWPPSGPRARPMPQSLNRPRDVPGACRRSRAPGARRSRPSSPVRHRRAPSAHGPGGRQDARQRQRPRQQAPRPARSRPQTARHGHRQRRQRTRHAHAPPGRASAPAGRFLPRPAHGSVHRARQHRDRQWRGKTRPESGRNLA